MTCYIVFYNKGKPICGVWKRGKDREECAQKAEWALLCNYPDVDYDDFTITREVCDEVH